MRIFKTFLIMVTLWAGSVYCAPVVAQCFTHELIALEGNTGTNPMGATTLCIREHSLQARIELREMPPRQVYSAWWVYFPMPGQCLQAWECSYADLLEPYGGSGTTDTSGDTPRGVLGRLASRISRRSGEVILQGRLRGLRVNPGAELWLALIAHGSVDQADGPHRARQFLTPETPELGTPQLGNDTDGWLGLWRGMSVFDFGAYGAEE